MFILRMVVLLVFLMTGRECFADGMINKVVAVVNDEVITQEDINQLLSILYAQYVRVYQKDELLKKMEEAKLTIVKQVIEDKLILSRAKELNIRVSDEEIKEKLDYVKEGFPSENEFFDMLRSQGITIADLKQRYRDQIMMRKAVNFEVRSRVNVLPSEISDYYEKHRSEMRANEKYRVRHILIKSDNNVADEMARVEINQVYEKLKSGESFEKLAMEYSQGPNKEQGGDMGYIERGEMLEELDNAIVKLKPGEFSAPVRTRLGYHLLKVEDVQYSGYLSLEDSKRDIEMFLFQQKMRKKLEEWLADLRSKAYISIK